MEVAKKMAVREEECEKCGGKHRTKEHEYTEEKFDKKDKKKEKSERSSKKRDKDDFED